jgi:hypothetical protein
MSWDMGPPFWDGFGISLRGALGVTNDAFDGEVSEAQNTSTCGLEFTPKQFGAHKNMFLEPAWHGIGPAKLLLDDMNQQTLWDITYQKDPKSIAYSRLQYLYI